MEVLIVFIASMVCLCFMALMRIIRILERK